jgi:peptidoglycan hydrolase FlgJ
MVVPLAPIATSLAGSIAAQGIKGIVNALSGKTPDKAKETANQFETMFLENSFERLFATDSEEGPLGNSGPGSEFYKSMLVKEYASNIVKKGGIGIASQVYGEMLKLQEGSKDHGGS